MKQPQTQPALISISTLEELAGYVAETLANLEMLKADQFQLTQQVLYRGGQPCGVHFCLQGPRALSLSAVWEMEGNTVLFYSSCGQRVRRTRLRARQDSVSEAS